MYFKHLHENVILAFYITNKFLDLLPVMAGINESLNRNMYYFFQPRDPSGAIEAAWVPFTNNKDFLNNTVDRNYDQRVDVKMM